MKTVKMFERGDYVKLVKDNNNNSAYYGVEIGAVGYVIEDSVNPDVMFTENMEELCCDSDEVVLITEAEYLKAGGRPQDPILNVDSLDEEIRVDLEGKYVEVGCQEIDFEDAVKIAEFLNKHCSPKKVAKKKATKKVSKKK